MAHYPIHLPHIKTSCTSEDQVTQAIPIIQEVFLNFSIRASYCSK
jgi:hypothetical protein